VTFLTIEDWLQSLPVTGDGTLQISAMHDFISATGIKPESLHPYVFYDGALYTRNLIYKSDRFEILATCWDVGQGSLPHGHDGQNCWMVVPVGRLVVQNYRIVERDTAAQTCRLEPTIQYEMTPDSPAAVDFDEPVHQVTNPASFESRAVSVHVYALPISVCEVYDLERATYSNVKVAYFSEYGKISSRTD
jgi:cysteine dioxygenase